MQRIEDMVMLVSFNEEHVNHVIGGRARMAGLQCDANTRRVQKRVDLQ